MADEWTGLDIDGRYVVEEVLGRGGMGIVLRARHRFTGGQVALKMLHAELSGDARMQERFLTECRAAAAIGHPAIVQVLDAGKTPDGELYLAMELLEGRSLRAAMARTPGQRAPGLAPAAVRGIGLALLDALAAAHARGFVHRDLKPENVFLAGPAGAVKLLDFGVAKSLAGRSASTFAGSVLGTVAYMAPEQLADASTVDGRADLWAVGVMLYELLAGALPYRATNLGEMMSALALSEPVPIGVHLPAAEPSVHAFFARALARDRAARFASAHDMARALAAAAIETAVPPAQTMGGLPTTVSGETDPQRATRRTAAVPPPAPRAERPPFAPPPASPLPASRMPAAPSPAPASARAVPFPSPAPSVSPRSERSPDPMVRPPARAKAAPERRWVGGVIAAVAVVAIVAGVAAIATSGHGAAAAAAALATDRSSPIDTGALDHPLDHLTDPEAPGSPADPSRAPTSIERAGSTRAPDAPTPEALCAAACRSGCGLEGPDCARICLADPRAVTCLRQHVAADPASLSAHAEPVRRSGNAADPARLTIDCAAVSSCVLGASCSGAPPRGDASCRDTYACERSCRDNIACGCSCKSGMSPAHALALNRLTTCALFVCANDAACVQARCSAALAACEAR